MRYSCSLRSFWTLVIVTATLAATPNCQSGGGGGGGARPDPADTTDNPNDDIPGVTTEEGTGADQGSDGSLQVISAAGAFYSDFDILADDGRSIVDQENEAGSLIPLSPGTYMVRETGNDDNVFGVVEILSNQTTTIELGAIRAQIVATYLILSGDEVQRRDNEPGQTISVPAGTYTIVSPSGGGVIAEDFIVEPGITTVIE